MLACVESAGTIEKPKLKVNLKANCRLTEDDKKTAERIIRYLFNVDFDLLEFYRETKNDSTMVLLTKKLIGLKSPRHNTPSKL